MGTYDRILHGIGTAVLFIFAIIIMTAGAFMIPSNSQIGFILIIFGSGILGVSIIKSQPEKSKEEVDPENNDRFQFR